jgi:1,4-alpha-glucan branching enzyme
MIDRAAPESRRAQKLSTLAAAVVLTSPGIPMLFQGQEFFDTTGFDFPDPPELDWQRTERFTGILRLYKDLIALRRDGAHVEGLRGDHFDVYRVDERRHLIALRRWRDGGAGDDVVVLLHFGGEPLADVAVGLPAEGVWVTRFNSDDRRYSSQFSGVGPARVRATSGDAADGQQYGAHVSIGGYAALILSQTAP